MPLPEKIEHVATFADGMNTSTAMEYVPKTQAKRIINCHIDSTAAGDTMIVTNIKGDVLINFALPAGSNFCLGSCLDTENLKFYFFNWNSASNHGIYQYDHAARVVKPVLISPILNFDKQHLILMTAVTHGGTLLHWVDMGWNEARKVNIQKAIDGLYGANIMEEYITAYKIAPATAPVAVYGTDTTRNTNMLYGTLMKFACRYIFDDGERSNWSDWSTQPVPDIESFSGVNKIPSANNFLDITVPTGSLIVTGIEIAMQRTIDTGLSPWELITTISKKKLFLSDNSQYVYRFYKDGRYPAIDQEKIIRPYSYLPAKPVCMAYTRKAMIYGNFYEGKPAVSVGVYLEVIYNELKIESGGTSETNSPKLIVFSDPAWTDYSSDPKDVSPLTSTFEFPYYPYRIKKFRVTVGNDVKKGNKFHFRLYNNHESFTADYTATNSDTATTVLNKIRKVLIDSKRLAKTAPGMTADTYATINDGNGNMSFEFIAYGSLDADYFQVDASVTAVSYDVLNDTGQSIKNIKMGSTAKFGFIYSDKYGRKYGVYTSDDMKYHINTVRQAGGLKAPVVKLYITHQPPAWATSYQIVRTKDLNYDNFIQILIQQALVVRDTGVGEYLDLVVGSLFTYQKMHPNTTLNYEFKKGDRIRFIGTTGSFYEDFETEVLSYKDTTTDIINDNVTIDGTAVVTVGTTNGDHVGKFILINGVEREISASTDNTYTLSAPIGTINEKETLLSYSIIDRRGLLRIRKPTMEIADNTLVEIYTPPVTGGEIGEKQFYYFGKKFDIVNPGTATRFHETNFVNQSAGEPGVMTISEGSVYVRNRELPITNSFPGAQVQIRQIEDISFSDFYSSAVNDNGLATFEDTGLGEVHFGDRLRYSNVDIEGTSINGLNDFDNTDRKDYNDPYGDFKLLVYTENQILAFKHLKDCIIPVYARVIQDNAGTNILGASSELLNDIRYYGHKGGIGDNPESFIDAGTMSYHASPTEGVLVRLGGDGATPISSTYFVDNLVRDYILNAGKNKMKIFGGYDSENKKALFHFSGQGVTLSFDEEIKRFTMLQKQPEHMISFMGGMFSLLNGQLWEANKNEIRNSFYGVQYPMEIDFYVNTAPTEDKTFYVMELDSNEVWSMPNRGDLLISPSKGKSAGMQSRIKKGNFKLFKGKWVADIMRNMADPRFTNEVDALHSGTQMRGKVLQVRMVNNDTVPVRLISVTVKLGA